jgi:Epoxide hydrolase N terminus
VSDEITGFRIEIPDDDLADLRRRLHDARWPEPEPVTDWSQGVPLSYLQELCRYWAGDYDWRPTETHLNLPPQYRTEIDGLAIRFTQRHGHGAHRLLDLPRRTPAPVPAGAEKRFVDIRYWNEPARGGHFAAFEQPELFTREIRSFFRLIR